MWTTSTIQNPLPAKIISKIFMLSSDTTDNTVKHISESLMTFWNLEISIPSPHSFYLMHRKRRRLHRSSRKLKFQTLWGLGFSCRFAVQAMNVTIDWYMICWDCVLGGNVKRNNTDSDVESTEMSKSLVQLYYLMIEWQTRAGFYLLKSNISELMRTGWLLCQQC